MISQDQTKPNFITFKAHGELKMKYERLTKEYSDLTVANVEVLVKYKKAVGALKEITRQSCETFSHFRIADKTLRELGEDV